MSRYIDEKDVYRLVEPSGVGRVHCLQIDELPGADVVEVRHGEWIDKHCSICGETQPYTARGNAFATTFYQFKTKFCPECGAKMGGERREG